MENQEEHTMELILPLKKVTPVKSTAKGIVTLVEKNLYFTGGTIFIDHGHGINSIYSHLDTVLVKKNQLVLQRWI
jgi:murein DD-endopeptidase MepM/ murein hydrolase activator NlpD